MRVWQIRREGSFPSQFYGKTYDGVYFYGRYRHGRLTVGLSSLSEDDAIQVDPAITIDDGTGDGVMELEEFLRVCRQHGPSALTEMPGRDRR